MSTQQADATTKPTRVTLRGLRHSHPGMKTEAFFAHIDECGGWPLDYPYVGFAHSDEREAAFTMEPVSSGWWTTLYHRDDYLMWKLSPDAWLRIFEGVRDDLSRRVLGLSAPSYGPKVRGWRLHAPTPLHPEFEQRALGDVIGRSKGF